MKLYDGKIPAIAQDIVSALVGAGDLEVESENMAEVELDVQAVLKEYVRMEREITEQAKDLSYERGSGHGGVFKLKRRLAKEKNFRLGEDAIEYLVRQLIETFYHTMFVEEVFADDKDLRKRISPVIKRHTMNVQAELDREVRSKIKNLEEGSKTWDIEYQRAMDRIKRVKNLE